MCTTCVPTKCFATFVPSQRSSFRLYQARAITHYRLSQRQNIPTILLIVIYIKSKSKHVIALLLWQSTLQRSCILFCTSPRLCEKDLFAELLEKETTFIRWYQKRAVTYACHKIVWSLLSCCKRAFLYTFVQSQTSFCLYQAKHIDDSRKG